MGEMGFATPIRVTTITNQADTKVPATGDQTRWYVGCQITSGAAATTVVIRDGTDATGAVKFTHKVEAINTTRLFMQPFLVRFDNGVFADVDANTFELNVYHG